MLVEGEHRREVQALVLRDEGDAAGHHEVEVLGEAGVQLGVFDGQLGPAHPGRPGSVPGAAVVDGVGQQGGHRLHMKGVEGVQVQHGGDGPAAVGEPEDAFLDLTAKGVGVEQREGAVMEADEAGLRADVDVSAELEAASDVPETVGDGEETVGHGTPHFNCAQPCCSQS
mgnify:CR=1 FL=1